MQLKFVLRESAKEFLDILFHDILRDIFTFFSFFSHLGGETIQFKVK